MIIWKTLAIKIRNKFWHIRKLKKRLRRSFANDYGDVPVGRINEVTGKFEPTVNLRGNSYAKRNDVKYRKKKAD